jgi:hypothetical protein
MGIANFFYLLQSALLLKSIDERLDRRVSDTFVLREAFQDLAHRRGLQFPVLFQDASFGFGKTLLFHDLLHAPAMLLQVTAYWLSVVFLEMTLQVVSDKRPCMRKSNHFVDGR